MNHMRAAAALLAISICWGGAAQAVPVRYSFQSSSVLPIGPDVNFASQFSGLFVSGSFDYDADALLTSEDDVFASYAGAFLNLTGMVDESTFAHETGWAAVANDSLPIPLPVGPSDLFHLSAVGPGSSTGISSGFTFGGLDLFNVRLYWAESPITGELVNSRDLLASLPTAPGYLALDFRGEDGPLRSVFFGASVAPAPTQVPEPAPLLLFATALSLMCVSLRARRGAR